MKQFTLSGKLSVFNRYLPTLYIVKPEEAKTTDLTGIPCLISDQSPDRLFMFFLFHWLQEKISQEVRWSKVIKETYGIREADFTGIWYKTSGFNVPTGENHTNDSNVAEEVLDMGSYVNAEKLMQLKLLPAFAGELADNITLDLSNYAFLEGYDKKRNLCSGGWKEAPAPKNLIIIDVSGSIPIGIADMMLYLAGTMAYRLQADVIVTGAESYFYPYEKAIALDPVATRQKIGRSNETEMFTAIMINHVVGHTYSNVVSFGDQDSWYGAIDSIPSRFTNKMEKHKVNQTKIGRVYHFHTQVRNQATGYGAWANQLTKEDPVYTDPDKWCNMFTEARRWQ
jgi:hypothetical protein